MKDKTETSFLSNRAAKEILHRLRKANQAVAKAYPGESGARQPVHTFYGGAHLFKADTAQKLGNLAQKSLQEYAPDAATFAQAIGLGRKLEGLTPILYNRVLEKLKREPVEDFRIDFEDGYGNRPDIEEDHHARQAAEELAQGMAAGTIPPFIGIRIKPLSGELHARSLRTLDLFLSTLAEKTRRNLPDNFFVTLPKITHPEQVVALAKLLTIREKKTGLAPRSIRVELMIETSQSVFASRGQIAIPELVAAAEGRCVGAHFGTYDYTAGLNITAAHQHMTHPACDFARHAMQVSLAGTGIFLSDGGTNIMPVAVRHLSPEGPPLTTQQAQENGEVVHKAWKLHFDHIQHSLIHGYYQGWDLHPAQLPTRYAALYAFFLEGLQAASLRLKSFMEKAARATLVGDVFDDAATGQGLLNFFLRGLNCGAIAEEEIRGTGLTLKEIQTRSFLKILGLRSSSHGP